MARAKKTTETQAVTDAIELAEALKPEQVEKPTEELAEEAVEEVTAAPETETPVPQFHESPTDAKMKSLYDQHTQTEGEILTLTMVTIPKLEAQLKQKDQEISDLQKELAIARDFRENKALAEAVAPDSGPVSSGDYVCLKGEKYALVWQSTVKDLVFEAYFKKEVHDDAVAVVLSHQKVS